ncbi:NUDIX hydrolase [Streptomyces sp. Edi2]|uniref:NUDIX hydrolase n=1 Tax=Streptomyces sp. Edi2 TaxID=3162528 RepID=UPI0033059C1B
MGSEGRWQRRGTEMLFAGGPGGRVRLTVDQAVRPDGKQVAYPHVAAPDSVRVLAVHRGRVPVVTQHHYLHDAEITDLPGGLVDESESPQTAAGRELTEETGLRAAWLHPLGAVATARAASTEKAHLFLAHGCTAGASAPDAGEALTAGWRSWYELAETDAMALSGVFPLALADAASLAAVQRAGAAMRAVGGLLPAPGDDLPAAAFAAYTVAELRDPLLPERLTLVWLDLAIGSFAEGAAILAELEASCEGPAAEEAWERAAHRLWSLAGP